VIGPRLVLATTNAGKLREMRAVLAGSAIALLDLGDFPAAPEPEETGVTFEDNARLKALHYASLTNLPTVAEDSGLEIDALGGDPGVRSARFLGAEATYEARFAAILERMAALPDRPRTARFVCALAVAVGPAILFEARGTVEGEIAPAPAGRGGFGYDPIFHYPPYGSTLAEVGLADKLAVAHRGQAFRELRRWIEATPGSHHAT